MNERTFHLFPPLNVHATWSRSMFPKRRFHFPKKPLQSRLHHRIKFRGSTASRKFATKILHNLLGLHLCPSPQYPFRHVHWLEIQTAWWWQPLQLLSWNKSGTKFKNISITLKQCWGTVCIYLGGTYEDFGTNLQKSRRRNIYVYIYVYIVIYFFIFFYSGRLTFAVRSSSISRA